MMMHLSEPLRQYADEQCSAREAQRQAEFIAFGPIVFQVSRLMVKWGILELLRDEALTSDEIAQRVGISPYAAKCLLEASLTIGSVLVEPETGRYGISKTGWFLLNDPATRVNLDFYLGMYDLEEALREGRPAGLKRLGDWPTVYEGLSRLPEDARRSWFAFDHFYSDSSFDNALRLVFANRPRTLMDVGGNTGRWAMQCVAHDKEVEVTIVDLPQQLELMRRQTSGKDGADRIHGHAANLLDEACLLPADRHWDAIWTSILRRAARVMDNDSRLYIMETLWDRQRFEPAAFCLTQVSLYFTAIANGNSKMYHSDDLIALIEKAGLEVEEIVDGLGQGHSIIKVKRS